MKIALLFGLLCYYFVFSILFFGSTANPLNDIGSVNYDNNSTSLQSDTDFSLLGFLGSIGSFFLFVFFGIGVLTGAPAIVTFIMIGWQSIMTILTFALLIDFIITIIP